MDRRTKMITSNRQWTEETGGRAFAAAGLFLLFALLISFAGTSASFANSGVLVQDGALDKNTSSINPMGSMKEDCPHQNASLIIRPHGTQRVATIQEVANAQVQHDCRIFCGDEGKIASSSWLRSKSDGDWLALLDDEHSLAGSLRSLSGLNSGLNTRQPPFWTSQLKGLSGAQAEFVLTVRLLV